MQKTTKKKGKTTARDQFIVVLEDINSKIGLVVDGQKMADEKFERFKVETEDNFKLVFARFAISDARFEEFRAETRNNFVEVEKKFAKLFVFQSDTENNFKIVLSYLSRIDDELQEIKAEIKELKVELGGKVELERVLVLEKKVKMLEQILIKQKCQEI